MPLAAADLRGYDGGGVHSSIDLGSVRNRLGLATRLSDVPLASTVRGVWLTMAGDHVKKLGRAEAATWHSAVPQRRRVPFLSYSLREYMEELAVAGAIVNPKDPAEGMRVVWRASTSMYLTTPFGRSLVRLLSPNPLRCMSWLVDHHDHFCNYGQWSLVQHADRYVTMEMKDEYVWIDSAQRGGAEGLLLALNMKGTVEPELDSRYKGRLHIRWSSWSS